MAEPTTRRRALLPPSLFRLVVRARIPYQPTDAVDFDQLGPYIFGTPPYRETVSAAAWPALVAFSARSDPDSSDLTGFLPDPSDASYPEQCLVQQQLQA